MASSKAYNPLETQDDVESGDAATAGVFVGYADFGNELRSSAGSERHLYFLNCCCDFRRAVLVLNGISILLRVFLMIFFVALANYTTNHLDEVEAAIDDDQLQETVDMVVTSGMMPLVEAIMGVLWGIGIVFGGIAIYGALQFKRWAIVTALWFYGFALVVVILGLDFVDGIFYGLAVYAHWHMAKLMKAEIMTNENYHNIAACCGK